MKNIRPEARRMKSRMSCDFVAALIVIVAGAHAQAASFFSNAIDGTNPNSANPFTAGQSHDPNIVVSGVGRGPTTNGNNANNRYNARDWSFSSLDVGDYFTFTIAPNLGFAIDFNHISGGWQRSNTGPNQYALRTSVDDFVSDVASGSITGSGSEVTYNLDLSALQDVTSSIELRLYAWGGNNAAGTFSFNSFAFDGQVRTDSGGPTPFAGDYNGDEAVDSADYVTWRKNLMTSNPLLNETESLGFVDELDFSAWRANFGGGGLGAGAKGGTALTASVIPEPTSISLLMLGAFFGLTSAFAAQRSQRNDSHRKKRGVATVSRGLAGAGQQHRGGVVVLQPRPLLTITSPR